MESKWAQGFAQLSNLIFTKTAEKDLKLICDKDAKSFRQITDDLKRLGMGTLPLAGRKKLKTLDVWQFDAGRFRVLYKQIGAVFCVVAIFAKSEQKKRFRGLH